MICKTLTVTNEEGLHSRPAKDFSKMASSFKSKIAIEKDGESFNAKSMLMVLSACVCCGDSFTLKVDGQDEEEAMAALENLVANMK